MTFVIADLVIEGKGVIANCDALTNDTGGTGTGDWTEQGGGTMTLTTDVFLYGTSSIAGKYASKSGFQQFDIGAGNELDFTAGTGTEDGQFIYIWVNLSAFGVLQTLAGKGLAIRISSDSPGTSNYCDYTIAGSDGANGWTGGWKLFVLDPTKTPSVISGTQSSIIASVRTLGIWIDTAASVRAESLFIDQIAVGSGIRVANVTNSTTISSTTGWADLVGLCTDYANRAWGMLQERDGIYYAFGKLFIGNSVQTGAIDFSDTSRIIQFGTSQYYESAAWKSTFDIDGAGLIVEDAASFTTTFKDGIKVGTDAGRSGCSYVGNEDQNVSLDLYGGSNAASLTTIYGVNYTALHGTLVAGDDANHEFMSVSFSDCNQFDPVGAPVLRNLNFVDMWDDGTADASKNSALLWNGSIDIADCNFLANTHASSDIAHGIEYPVAGTFSHVGMNFSGNEKDVHFSAATGNLVINKDGNSNATTSTNDSTGTVTIQGSTTFSLTISNEAGTLLEGISVRFEETGGTLISDGTTNASGLFTYSDTIGNRTIKAIVRKKGYKGQSFNIVVTGDFNIPRSLTKDTSVNRV